MLLHFTKMEGCGNDYIYVNGFTEHVPQEKKPEIVRKLSDRHFGIGGDGVIFINPSKNADFEMEMYNADGSRGEMCGNGIRCVGKYVYDRGMTQGREIFDVESFGKVKHLVMTCENGKAVRARVNMGAPILEAAEIPVIADHSPVVDEPIEVQGREWRMTCVSVGNPHAVVFLEDSDLVPAKDPAAEGDESGSDETGNGAAAHQTANGTGKASEELDIRNFDIAKYGPYFEHHKRFPNRINTEFVQVIDRQHVKMRVWERGTGETLACGTGVCATAVACILNGKTDRKIEVEIPGGKIIAEWDEQSGDIFMTGPAAEVFSGEIEI